MNKRIGIVAEKMYIDMNREQLSGILDEAYVRGIGTYIFSQTGEMDKNDIATVKDILSNALSTDKLDGIIYLPYTFTIQEFRDEMQRFLLENCSVPVVRIGTEKVPFRSVWFHDRAEIAEITRHLIQVHGCRVIYCLTGPVSQQVAHERLAGFLDAMSEASLPVEEHAVIFGDFWVYSARELAQEIASGSRPKPDAVVCGNDTMAMSLCDALAELGLTVPGDILVTGYDGSLEAELHSPPVTTYRTSWRQLGRNAFCLLYEMITGSETNPRFHERGTLLCRESCGCKPAPLSENQMVNERHSEQQYLDMDVSTRLMSCQDLKCFVRTMYDCTFVFRDTVITENTRFALCLFRNWESAGLHSPEILEMYYNGDATSFPMNELIPPSFRGLAEPSAVFFTPVYFREHCFGYMALRFESDAISFSALYMRFCRDVGNALEYLRIRNAFRHLQAETTHRQTRDVLTGLYCPESLPHLWESLQWQKGKQHFWIALSAQEMYRLENGSRLLEEFAERLRSVCCHGEVCFYAGEGEFLVLGAEDAASGYHTLLTQRILECFSQGSETESPALQYAVRCEPLPATAEKTLQAARALLEEARTSLSSRTEQPHYEELAALREEIYQHPERDWSLRICSEKMRMSSSYFHRIYLNAFGISCAGDIRRSKLEYACRLLLHTADTLQEIARKCGYDYSHFMRMFRKEIGQTPTEFRSGKKK